MSGAPEEKTNTALAFALAAGMIIFGTASTELSNIQFNTKSQGVDTCDTDDDGSGHTKDCKFDKPYFNVLIMKFGMSLCYFLYKYERKQKEKAKSYSTVKLEQGDSALISSSDLDNPTGGPIATGNASDEPGWDVLVRITIPAFTDLVQTVLAMAGLLWVDPSIYQMCRGSVVIFSALLSVTWLKKTLTRSQLIAVGLVLLAIIFVGLAGIEKTENEDDDDSDGSSVMLVIVGLALIIAGQFIGAVQFILEEELMTKFMVSPTQLVAWEGIWGMMILLVLYIPLYYTPSSSEASAVWHENIFDALTQVKNSNVLIVTSVVSVFVLLAYNWVGNMITKYLNAVARSMLEACRTIGVWTVGLILYYPANSKGIGEEWTHWSFLELGGFVLLVYGTLAYKDIVPINPLELLKKKPENRTSEPGADTVDYSRVAIE